jgi:hypothetical protein
MFWIRINSNNFKNIKFSNVSKAENLLKFRWKEVFLVRSAYCLSKLDKNYQRFSFYYNIATHPQDFFFLEEMEQESPLIYWNHEIHLPERPVDIFPDPEALAGKGNLRTSQNSISGISTHLPTPHKKNDLLLPSVRGDREDFSWQ